MKGFELFRVLFTIEKLACALLQKVPYGQEYDAHSREQGEHEDQHVDREGQ